MFESFLRFESGKIFFPNIEKALYKRPDGTLIAETIADGVYAQKLKHGNRQISFTARFDIPTGALFREESKDKRHVKFFDAKNLSVPINIVINEISYSNEYIEGINLCLIQISAIETNPTLPTPPPVITATQVLSAIFTLQKIIASVKSLDLPQKLVNSVIAVAISPLQVLSALKETQNLFDISTQIKLAGISIKESYANAFSSSAQIHNEFAKNLSQKQKNLSPQQVECITSAFFLDENDRPYLPENFTDEFSKEIILGFSILGSYAIYVCVNSLDFSKKTTDYLLELQSQIYDRLQEILTLETDFFDKTAEENPLKNSDILLTAIQIIEENLLKSRRQMEISFDFSKDIYTAVSEIYPCVNAQEFESAFNNFVEDNKIMGDELFVLIPHKKYKYSI